MEAQGRRRCPCYGKTPRDSYCQDIEDNGSGASLMKNTRVSKLNPKLNITKIESIPDEPEYTISTMRRVI